jgi:CubicO group peptidase (beta-lactamase class C family)
VLIFQINVFAQTVSNSPDSTLHSYINDLVVQGFEEGQFPGISMALFYDDSVHYYHQGHSKLETEFSVNSSTLFHLGSIGKLLTAIAVLQQVDEGSLDLHQDIGEYITFTEKRTSLRESNPITVHCLLTHSCGYNDVNIGYMAKDEESLLSL